LGFFGFGFFEKGGGEGSECKMVRSMGGDEWLFLRVEIEKTHPWPR
jgi:hypothetical protein